MVYNSCMIPFADVLIALRWGLVLLLLVLPGWALVQRFGKVLPDSGYALGKGAGVLGIAALTWVLSTLGLVPFTPVVLWLLVAAAWAWMFTQRHELLAVWRRRWRGLLIVEGFSAVLYAVALAMRSFKPEILGIEKYMDAALLNSLLRHRLGAPVDPWYAGEPINYYYFGHWVIAAVAKLADVPGQYAFSLGFATVVSLAGASLLTIGWTLSRRLSGGLLTVFLALFASNLHPFLAWLRGQQNYFFFNSGRFVEQRINEYPFYSLSLGDLHAHMLSLVLTTNLALLAVVYLLVHGNRRLILVLMGGLLGLMAATNAFDTLTCSVLVGLVLLAGWYRTPRRPLGSLLEPALYVAAGAAPFIVVFLLHFRQPTGGLGFAGFQIPLLHYVWQFGIMAVLAAAPLLAYVLMRRVGVSQLVHQALHAKDPRGLLVGLFGLTAMILMVVPQLVFVKDLYYYVNPPFALANTQFKVWYTAWIMLAIAAAGSVVLAGRLLQKRSAAVRYGAYCVLAGACLVLSVGTYRGLLTLRDSYPNTIDGLRYLQVSEPDKYAAVQWANDNLAGQPVVLEAAGDSYSIRNWFSAYTGLPTLIGWPSHEWGWRYSDQAWPAIAAREAAVRRMYAAHVSEEIRGIAGEQGIAYVLVGPDETALYGAEQTVFRQAFGEPVFQTGRIAIYRVQ